MRVGVIGPTQIVAKTMQIIRSEFPQLEPVPYIYASYTETPQMLRYHQLDVDVLLFTGKTPFTLAGKVVQPAVPWEYVPRSGSTLLRLLLYAKLWTAYDIRNISFDTYNQDLLYEAYQEIGIPREQLNIHIAEERSLSEHYQAYVCEFHRQNYRQNHVSCCVTALQGVYDELCAQAIPCLLLEPTTNIIRETIYKLQLKYLIKVSQQNQLVAICVQIDEPAGHSLFADNEYQDALNRLKVSEQIYLFAQRLQAAVIETGDKNYLLFTTTQMLENETNQLKSVELLDAVKNSTHSTISLGIGYGKTANEAKNGALQAMTHAIKQNGNLAYLVYDGKKMIGPLERSAGAEKKTDRIIDEKFLLISEKVGVSVNTVFKLHCIKEQFGKTDFTVNELAPLFGVTTRTMNRIIEKFALQGYCNIVGKRVMGLSGRPSRIISLTLEQSS